LFSSIDAVEKELPLVLRFLEQLVHDIIMARSSPSRVIHSDLAEDLGKMRDKRADEEVWHLMLKNVRALREKIRARVALPFQVKNLFAQAFWV
jgi:hypothetical protein